VSGSSSKAVGWHCPGELHDAAEAVSACSQPISFCPSATAVGEAAGGPPHPPIYEDRFALGTATLKIAMVLLLLSKLPVTLTSCP
jgi:hypothetical protein